MTQSGYAKPMNLVGKKSSVLHEVAVPILDSEVDGFVTLAARMLATCRVKGGIAIAAPQVGVPVQLIVQWDGKVLINPEILYDATQDLEPGLEGCLSLPGRTFRVERFQRCSVSAWDLSRERNEYDAEGLDARMIQHEMDHLNGVLICDRGREVKGTAGGMRM